MRFWDSSGIVPLLVPQPATADAERLMADDTDVVVWWSTPVECVSALTRLMREGKLGEDAVELAVRRLDAIIDGSAMMDPAESIRNVARRLLRVHLLRAADALQLAAAIELRGSRPERLEIVSFDQRLSSAARREGFQTP